MLICTFTEIQKRTDFQSLTGIAPNDQGIFTIPLSLCTLAESMQGTVQPADSSEHQFLVQVDSLETVLTPHTKISEVGEDGLVMAGGKKYWAVKSSEGLTLFRELSGKVEQIDVPVKLMSEIPYSTSTDNLPVDYDWARLRMTSRTRPLKTEFTLAQTNFIQKPNVVVIDSGINFSHNEFQGLETENLFALSKFNGDFNDNAGHGTGVASAVCGDKVGIHRHLKLLNVKIFDKDTKPNALEIGQALDACYQKYLSNTSIPMIVNCSWTVAKNTYLEDKFKDLLSAGIAVVAAAGNSGADTQYLTPAGIKNVLTVAASDQDDIGAGFNNFSQADLEITSNMGEHIDMFAPGVDVWLASYQEPNKYIKVSGSSASAGYVSGCMAAASALFNVYRRDAFRITKEYATKGSLLLDTAKFTMDQNHLAYLITSDNHIAQGSYSWNLGAVAQPVEFDADIVLPTSRLRQTIDMDFTYSLVVDEDNSFINDSVSFNKNFITVNNPTNIVWGPYERIKLCSFKIRATADNSSISFDTPNLIFFAVNPNVTDVSVVASDIATALENVDNQSFFAAWAPSKIGTTSIK